MNYDHKLSIALLVALAWVLMLTLGGCVVEPGYVRWPHVEVYHPHVYWTPYP